MDCVSERSDTVGTVGPKPDETPDTASSELGTDSSAADIGNLGNARSYRIFLF